MRLRAVVGCLLLGGGLLGLGCGGTRCGNLLALGCGAECHADTGAGTPDAQLHHYFDWLSGAPLQQWDFIWGALLDYYGRDMPEIIAVKKGDGRLSRFWPPGSLVMLGARGWKAETVAHESVHLCNYNLTKGASNTNRFRFVDEGFASIMGHGIAGEGDWYKSYALAVAKQELQKGNVSLAKVQDWGTYFGSPATKANWRAYQVGSSFDYLIQDTRGPEAFRSFLEDIGVTRNLETTLQNLFHSSSSAMEEEWHRYLNEVVIDQSAPSIQSFSPPDGANDVSLDTSEISVAFSVAMGGRVCIDTPCGDTGVCPSKAYWKAKNVLAIKVTGRLKAATDYKLALGNEKTGCQMTSYAGVPLPLSHWHFTTARQ